MNGRLADLHLRTSYHKGRDDIAADFYLPCMRNASEYDRAVGYFRSTIFTLAWAELKSFISRGGKIRVLCSQILSDSDVHALQAGYSARNDHYLAKKLVGEVRSLLADDSLHQPTRILAALVAQGTLDLQIAILTEADSRKASAKRIFHDKLGIFRDDHGGVVVFKGSMNETWTGLSRDGNLESVDVAANWMGARDLERVRNEEAYFSDLWSNKYPNLRVLPFPDVARDEILRAADPDWERTLDQILETGEIQKRQNSPDSRGRVLRPHQADGLSSWSANGRTGILAFATGSGKTFTAITAIREAVTKYSDTILVVVPDRVLFDQWFREIRETTADIGLRVLRAGAGNDNWRNHLQMWTSPGELPRLVLATAKTACSSDFRNRLAGGTHLMLVADEVHRLGSPRNSQVLDEEGFGARLGLSATPERAGDPTGTEKILSFFRGILTPRYELTDAIRDLVLTKYFYRPHTVQLSEEEADNWHAITVRIGQLTARIEGGGADRKQLEARRDGLYIRRARIVKHAAAKVPLAVEVLRSEYKRGQKWIVYCEDLAQLNAVGDALTSSGVPVIPFHSKMLGSRDETLRWLDRRGGVVTAIKCLDEGVDVPSVTHALILASSKNPREFTQRRGRVLRTAPGKSLAFVHDAIVLPPRGDMRSTDPITAGELARAVQFAANADNPAAASDLQQIAVSLKVDWRSLQNKGIEDAED